jgi:hypothetical protein
MNDDIKDFIQSFLEYVNDNYYNDRVMIVNAINEFCVDNDIDYDVDLEELEEDDIEFYDDEEFEEDD